MDSLLLLTKPHSVCPVLIKDFGLVEVEKYTSVCSCSYPSNFLRFVAQASSNITQALFDLFIVSQALHAGGQRQ